VFIGEDWSPSINVRFVGLRVHNKQSMLNCLRETACGFRYAYILLQKLSHLSSYFYNFRFLFYYYFLNPFFHFLVEQCITGPASSKWRVGTIENTEHVTEWVKGMLFSRFGTCASNHFIHFRHKCFSKANHNPHATLAAVRWLQIIHFLMLTILFLQL
jgi:hypothetical protein